MAPGAAVFDKIALRSEDDLRTISKLLENAFDEYTATDEGRRMTPELRNLLENKIKDIFMQIKQFVVIEDDSVLTPGFGGGLERSPGLALPPLSPLPFDPEVQDLETQVIQASNEVSELRASMQTALQSKLAAHLAECRPSGSLMTVRQGEADESKGEQDEEMALASMSPPPQELTKRLMSASGKVPELLARLENAENRLQRILAATPGNADESGV